MNKQAFIAEHLRQARSLIDECINALNKETGLRSQATKSESELVAPSVDLDYEIPARPFMKKYGRNLSGAKKFTLLLARMAEGHIEKEIALSAVQAEWDRMASLLGEFNYFFPAQAKENDWVETKKKGLYNLRPSWKSAVGHHS